jgi:hypothetical protein
MKNPNFVFAAGGEGMAWIKSVLSFHKTMLIFRFYDNLRKELAREPARMYRLPYGYRRKKDVKPFSLKYLVKPGKKQHKRF